MDQRNQENAWIQGQMPIVASERATMLPFASDLMKSTGYSDAEKGAMTGNAMEATDAAFDTGQQSMEGHVAKTGNDAGFFGNEAALSRERAGSKADTARTLQTQFADEQQKRRMQGAQLYGAQSGQDANLLASMYGLPNQSINAAAGGIGRWSAPFGIGAG